MMDPAQPQAAGVLQPTGPAADGGKKYSLAISHWPPGFGKPAVAARWPARRISKIAMFDEGNEGTAIFRAAPRRLDAPDRGLMDWRSTPAARICPGDSGNSA